MAILLALLAAAGWGSSDYAAGVASRRSSALSVVVLTHLTGAVLLAVAVVVGPGGALRLAGHALSGGSDGGARLTLDVLLLPGAAVPGTGDVGWGDLGWGAAAGLSGGIGAVLLFRGLARGAVNVVAPITAVVAALIPVAAGLVTGQAPGLVGLGAVVVALVAITLISEPAPGDEPDDVASPRRRGVHARRGGRHVRSGRQRRLTRRASRPARPGVAEALGSGAGFGGFYLLLARTADDAGLWPILSARTASVLLFAAAALFVRERLLPARPDRRLVVVAGLLDAVAAVAFLAATHRGLLSVVAVLSSLYPAATIALAALFDHERCSRRQWAGLGLAAVSVGVLVVA